MNKKKAIIVAMYVLASVGMALLAYPFIASMSVSAKSKNESLVTIEIPTLTPGKLLKIGINGKTLFLLKPDQEQEDTIESLTPHVWNASTSSFNKEIGAYMYWGHSTKWGCPLELLPRQESRLLDWEPNAQWLGGYWDDWCEVSYDYAGRTIKTYAFTRNGYNAELPNLHSPEVFIGSKGKYIVSIYER